MLAYFVKVLEETTFHGVGEIVRKTPTFSERLFWLVTFTVSFVCSLYLINESWRKFQDSPTIVTIERNFHEWKIPQPAIIICPPNIITTDYMDLVTELFGEVDEEKQDYYANFLNDFSNLNSLNMKNMIKYENDASIFNINLADLQIRMRNDLAMEVYSYHIYENLEGEPLPTQYGSCIAYGSVLNIISRNSYENATEEIEINSANSEDELHYTVMEVSNENKAFLTSPFEYPDITGHYNHVEEGGYNAADFLFKVLSTISTPDVRDLSIRQRKCMFHDELQLSVSHIYTRVACKMQCKYEQLMDACKCSPLLFFNLGNYEDCNIKGLACIARQQELIPVKKCSCLAACNEDNFEINLMTLYPEESTPYIDYEMLSFPTFRYIRSIIFRDLEMLVSFGGTACFFIGGSLLSVVELFYLVVLHLTYAVTYKKKISVKPRTFKRISRREALLRRIDRINNKIRNKFLGKRAIRADQTGRRYIDSEMRLNVQIPKVNDGNSIYLAYKALCEAVKEYLELSTICGIRHIKHAPHFVLRLLWFCISLSFVAVTVLVARELTNSIVGNSIVYVVDTDTVHNISAVSLAFCVRDDWNGKICSELFIYCSVNGIEFNCCSYFEVVHAPTYSGYCLLFNSFQFRVAPKKWITIDKDTKLFFTLSKHDTLINLYFLSPYEVPVDYEYKVIDSKHHHIMDILVTTEIADNDVHNIPRTFRRCSFPEESNTMWAFQYYSLSACLAQCKVEARLKLCNCTDVFVGYNTEKQTTCELKGNNCIRKMEDKLENVNFVEEDDAGIYCNCPMSCTQNDLMLLKQTELEEFEDDDNATLTLNIQLATPGRQVIVAQSVVDIAVYIGGVCGLFLGASLLSFMEIPFFLLVRPFFIYLKYKSKVDHLQ